MNVYGYNDDRDFIYLFFLIYFIYLPDVGHDYRVHSYICNGCHSSLHCKKIVHEKE